MANKLFTVNPLLRRSLAVMAVLLLLLGFVPAHAVSAASPSFFIVSVVQDQTVTIQTSSFPANQLFTIRMGAYGTQAVGGIEVATTNSGAGGAFQATYTIPDALKGSERIDIRFDSSETSVYGWFQNISGYGSGSYYYQPIPTFSIVDVVKDQTVKISTKNFPADKEFTVRMGYYGTLGIGGYVVTTTNSGAGGSFEATYNIPDQLKGQQRIAIRLESGKPGYYAFNWFWNNTVATTTDDDDGEDGEDGEDESDGGIPGYIGYPSFSIASVVRDGTVTVQTQNLPPSLDFKVRMGYYGTQGIGGIVVETVSSGEGGSKSFTFNIPAELKGNVKIAIRMESDSPYYFAYNWFWNNTAN